MPPTDIYGHLYAFGAHVHSQAHTDKHEIKISKSFKTTTEKRGVGSENMLFDGGKK